MAKAHLVNGPCASCGHDPACGFASITIGEIESWYCHADTHSCYTKALRSMRGNDTKIDATRYFGVGWWHDALLNEALGDT